MKKSKTLLAMLLSCGLLLAGCNKGGDNTSSEEGAPTSNTSGAPASTASSQPLSPLDIAMNAIVDYMDAPNITLNMHVETFFTMDGHPMHTGVEQTIKFDNNKIYVHFNEHNYTAEPPTSSESDFYYELGETSYQYKKINEEWIKSPMAYEMNLRPSSQIYGFEQFVNNFKENCTQTEEGYFAQEFTSTVSCRQITEASGSDYSDYTYDQETIDITYRNVKITMQNGQPISLESESNSVGIQSSTYDKIVHVAINPDMLGKVKMYNFRDIGSTVVTLPIVAA